MTPRDSRTRRQLLQLAGAAALLPLTAAPALAQSWPARPIRLVVPFPPGGLIDNMARVVGPRLAQELGQPVVIDNKPGAGGNIGTAEAAKAAPDGYTLLMASPPLTISPALYKQLPYKPEQIAGVAMLGNVPNVLLVKAGSDITSVAQLTERAKSRPGRMNYASNGNGTSLHLSAELYKSLSGAFITHIPYRGAAAAMTALIAGEVDMMFDNLPAAMGQIQAGAVRPLAVTTPQRSPALPNVPTMAESGLAGFEVSAWFGMAVPAGTPAAVTSRLEQALERVLKVPEVAQTMQRQGAQPGFLDGRAMEAFMAQDAARWRRVVAFAKITLD
jgi:tripartite-type tricarboxylate transporter receptor subunit TctC